MLTDRFGAEDIADITSRVGPRIGFQVEITADNAGETPFTSAGEFPAVPSLIGKQIPGEWL